MYPLEPMVNSEFLLKGILSEVFLEQVRIVENRIKMPKINVLSLSNIILPLPPLPEQHRIVARVNELMTLCDALKDRLNKAGTIQVQLADALVEKALNSA
jgi:type I restriction enzyme S subunit